MASLSSMACPSCGFLSRSWHVQIIWNCPETFFLASNHLNKNTISHYRSERIWNIQGDPVNTSRIPETFIVSSSLITLPPRYQVSNQTAHLTGHLVVGVVWGLSGLRLWQYPPTKQEIIWNMWILFKYVIFIPLSRSASCLISHAKRGVLSYQICDT